MRRTAAFLLAVLCAFLLCACGMFTPREIVREHIEGPADEPARTEKGGTDDGRFPGGFETITEKVRRHGNVYAPKDSILNILLIGVDKDSRRNEVGRSDMLILCTIDFDAPSISLITVPRDTHAHVFQIADDGTVEGEVYEKINHAYTYGGGPNKYSAQNAMECTSRLLGADGIVDVPIRYYMSIDLDGLADLAEVLGGVSVVLDQDVPNVGKKGEAINLVGPHVRYYLENRHDMSDGEVTRQIHQQTFMKSLFEVLKLKGAERNAPELYNVFARFIRTNLTPAQFVACARILDAADLEDGISFARVTGEGNTIDGVWYLEPDVENMLDLVLAAEYEKR